LSRILGLSPLRLSLSLLTANNPFNITSMADDELTAPLVENGSGGGDDAPRGRSGKRVRFNVFGGRSRVVRDVIHCSLSLDRS
jgi:hypothetical protein